MELFARWYLKGKNIMFYIGGYYIQKMDFIKGCVDFLILCVILWMFLIFNEETYYFHYTSYFFHTIIVISVIFGLGGYDVPYKKSYEKVMIKKLTISFFLSYSIITILTVRLTFWDTYLWSILLCQHVLFFFTFNLFQSHNIKAKFDENILVISSLDEYNKIKKILSQNIIKYVNLEYLNINELESDILETIYKEKNISMIILGQEKKMYHLTSLAPYRFKKIRFLDIYLLQEQYLKKINTQRLYSYHVLFGDFFSVSSFGAVLKRAFDIFCALLILVLTSPISLLVMAIIFLTDRHKVLYSQKRIGQKGDVFECYKFRSMRINAEKNGQAVWAKENDDRVTPIGRFIRRTRIDEIPQCINVLKGDMSMIGPRPERPEFVEQLNMKIPYYNERHYVKPGITGWAQINEVYGASFEDAKRKLEYDFYYLKHNNLFLDIVILLKTISVIIWPNGVR